MRVGADVCSLPENGRQQTFQLYTHIEFPKHDHSILISTRRMINITSCFVWL